MSGDALRGWGCWALLALSVAAYAGVSLALGQPFHAGGLPLRYFDLRVYHLAELQVVHSRTLYGRPLLNGFGFTYPPFAALILTPLSLAPLRTDELVVTGLNVLLLVWTLERAMNLADRRRGAGDDPVRPSSRARTWSRAAAWTAAALWLEPITVTLGYGQINVLIVLLVVADLARPDAARTKGVGIGLAAAIKLTPLLFIPYLLFSRRPRAAVVAVATFAASIAFSAAISLRYTRAYWLHKIFQTNRIGNPIVPANQSLRGVFARLTGNYRPPSVCELIVIAVTLLGLALAVRASRRGDEAGGFSLAALSTLLASPISWSHHWTLAVPALLLLIRRAHRRRSIGLAAAAALLAVIGYAYLPEIAESDFHQTHGLISLLVTDPYPVPGVIVLLVCAGPLLIARTRRRPAGADAAATVGLPPHIGDPSLP